MTLNVMNYNFIHQLQIISDSQCRFLHCAPPSDMEFLEVLTEGLNRVLLVRGGGREVITIYS